MEDDYNILGKFENLSSVKLAKQLTKNAKETKESAKTKIVDESFDSLSDLEKTVSIGKQENKATKRTYGRVLSKTSSEGRETPTATVEKAIALEVKTDKEVEPSIVNNKNRRTRSSVSSDILETSVSSCTRSKKAKQSSVTKNNLSSNHQNEATSQTTKTRSKRGRKKTTTTTQESAVEQNTTNAIDGVNNPSANVNSENQETTQMPLGPTLNGARRARRNILAERAVRCPTVDVIDLISSPMPRVEGFISLDSDEEENVEKIVTAIKSPVNLETDFDDENPQMPIKIMWNALPEVFNLRKHQKFDFIFDQLAQREKTDKTQVFLNLDNKIIQPNDTPASINYKIFQFIHGRAMVDTNFANASTLIKKKRDRNYLVLKVQSDKWKKPLSIEMQKSEKFKKLIIKCSEELKMPYEKIKLSFDGEPLQLDQTPMDLEFDGGEVLEIHLKDDA